MLRRASAVDANQKEIVAALRRVGCSVVDLSAVGHGVPDLLVGTPWRRELVLMEVKDGAKTASQRKLTDAQIQFHHDWSRYPVLVVTSVDEALEVVAGMGNKI